MMEPEAAAEGDGTRQGRHDAALLVRIIDLASQRIVGGNLDSIPTEIAAHLSSLDVVDAAGVWLSDATGERLLLRGWESALPTAGARAARQLAEALANERWSERRPFLRSIAADDQPALGRAAVVAGFPLQRAIESGPALGIIVVVARTELNEIEMTVLNLLARQAAAELVRAHDEAGMARQRPVQTDPSAGTQFVALVAHELRTPLTALRGNVQLASMAMQRGDLERVDARLQAALKGVDQIAALVQNLQDMSHLERQKFQIARVKGNLAATVRNAAKRAERLIENDRYQIRVESPSVAESYFDPARMEQAVYNVLVNALQYSPQGGTVVVNVECGDEEVVVTVKDKGVGIPPEEQARVFEPYYRGSTAKATNAKGLGLGLTISRATLERHGGSIEVASSPGDGATFSLHLPQRGSAAR